MSCVLHPLPLPTYAHPPGLGTDSCVELDGAWAEPGTGVVQQRPLWQEADLEASTSKQVVNVSPAPAGPRQRVC